MQRAVELEGNVIGDVDQGRDRAQADGGQAVLQPFRAGSVLHAPEGTSDEFGTRTGGLVREVEGHAEEARERTRHRRGVERLQATEPRRREVAGDAAHAETIAPVGRDGDFDDRVGQAHDVDGAGADFGVRRQFDDAVVFLRQAHFPFRQQHAVRRYTPDFRGLQGDARARDVGPGGGEHALQSRPRVGRATDQFDRFRAGVNLADLQAVRVGMLFRIQNLADDEGVEALGPVRHAFDLEPDHGQAVGDFRQRGVGFQMLLEPAQGELHRFSPPVRDGISRDAKP